MLNWHCVCSHENQAAATHCEKCAVVKTEKIFPRWQRAMRDPETDGRKYSEPGASSKNTRFKKFRLPPTEKS